MSYMAVIAADVPAAESAPWWALGLWPLLGTFVGGLVTYFTGWRAHRRDITAQRDREQREAGAERDREKREADAERERQRRQQVTDISTRFIQAVAKHSFETLNIEDTLAEVQQKFVAASESENPLEALAELSDQLNLSNAQNFKPQFTDIDSQLNVASSLMTGMGAAGAVLSDLNLLVAEMRLVAPNEVAFVSEQVVKVCYFAKSSSGVSAFPLSMRMALAAMVTQALNVFVNEVRHNVGMPYYVPRNVTIQEVGTILDGLAAKQKNEV